MHLYKLLMGHALQPAAKEVLLAVDDDSSVPYSCREARVSICVRRCEGRCQTSIYAKAAREAFIFPEHTCYSEAQRCCVVDLWVARARSPCLLKTHVQQQQRRLF